MSIIAKKDARIEFKTTRNTKELLTSAASLSGQDLTSFVLFCAEERAKSVLAEYQSMALSREEQAGFMDALSRPAEPARSLRDLMEQGDLFER